MSTAGLSHGPKVDVVLALADPDDTDTREQLSYRTSVAHLSEDPELIQRMLQNLIGRLEARMHRENPGFVPSSGAVVEEPQAKPIAWPMGTDDVPEQTTAVALTEGFDPSALSLPS